MFYVERRSLYELTERGRETKSEKLIEEELESGRKYRNILL
jgi:hypothetical protein